MSFGELLSALLGWLGALVEWIFQWVPRYVIVRWNECGVKYPGGQEPMALSAGFHWYVPNVSSVVKHPSVPYVLVVEPISVETVDGTPVQVGLTLTLRIVDVLRFEVENYSADTSIDDVARGGLQDIITSRKWEQLLGRTGDGSKLGGMLVRRLGADLERFGVEVLSARPTDQVRLNRTFRVFGFSQNLFTGSREGTI